MRIGWRVVKKFRDCYDVPMLDQFPLILIASAFVVTVILAGAFARWSGCLTADASILKLIINILIPCLVFTVISDNPALRDPRNLIIPPTDDLKRVVAIEIAMPSAVFGVIMARNYGADSGTALRIILATSFISILTIPLWISVGMAVLLP